MQHGILDPCGGHLHLHEHSYEDYLHFDYESKTKHEYINGDIVAMTGGSAGSCTAIAINIGTALSNQLLATSPVACTRPDLKIRIEDANVATYPDVSVVCGQPVLDPRDIR